VRQLEDKGGRGDLLHGKTLQSLQLKLLFPLELLQVMLETNAIESPLLLVLQVFVFEKPLGDDTAHVQLRVAAFVFALDTRPRTPLAANRARLGVPRVGHVRQANDKLFPLLLFFF